MTTTSSPSSPPLEAQRFGRSQTPESPRPVHIPPPANIPVLRNQMDPVFNDTATYNVPHDQPFTSFTEPIQTTTNAQNDEHDAVQDFFRAAEEESSKPPPLSGHTEEAAPNPPAISNASEVDQLVNAALNTQPVATNDVGSTLQAPQVAEQNQMAPTQQEAKQDKKGEEGGVDYQSLLDTITQSASTAPTADALTALTTAAPAIEQGPSTSSLPTIPGLPPKPPALEHPADFAAYQMPEATPTATATSAIEAPTSQLEKFTASQNFVYEASPDAAAKYPAEGYEPATGDRPWSPQTQSIYDQFLEDERGFVTDGIWDKFPAGSRLFVGNLPSEKVTKRDLFHIFHRHGKLAQISIKQAYGFVQFLQASDCLKALEADQGVEIRGRKIHLEISKPQKNTRNANKNERNNNANQRRRSRSPVRRVSDDRHDFRDRRDYRRARSPSPRGYRSRDDGRHNARSPRGHMSVQTQSFAPAPTYPPQYQQPYDEDATLPLPRRNPQDVPDVQLLILDQSVPQAFINWVEDGFRQKGLRASTIWLSPRLPLQAVIKRQILEGVHAIVKLLQVNSMSYKVPLQVFDRSSGASNVKFNEYVDLDLSVAGDIVVHTKRSQPSPSTPYPPMPQFNATPQYGHAPMPSPQQYSPQGQAQFQQRPPQPQYPYPQQQQQQQYQHQYAQHQPPTPSSANSNAPNLQQLLANLGKPNDLQLDGAASAPVQARPDLSGLLSNIAASQQNQHQAYPTQSSPQSYGTAPNSAQGYGPPAQQNNVQNIISQLRGFQR